MSSNQDFVDKLFGLSSKIAQKSYDIADITAHSVVQSLDSIKDKIFDGSDADIFQPETVASSSGIFSSILPGINIVEPLKENWMYGLSISATTMLILWKWNRLLVQPDHVPQQKNMCVLIFGDMNDSIIRSEVMDLYRRRFTVFVCSEHSDSFKKFEEETDFIHPINPNSASDLTYFTEFISQTASPQNKLASVLFMPNLSYQPTGELSVNTMEHELRSNVLVYYNILLKLLPHLPGPDIQLLLFNPSLTYNLNVAHHSTELFISGFITSIFRSLQNYKTLDVSMINLGLFQVRGQLSNYKYINSSGSDIAVSLHAPVYKMIMTHNGNLLQKFVEYLCTCGGKAQIFYLGKFSFLSSLPFARRLIKSQIIFVRYFEWTTKLLKNNFDILYLKLQR
ncbi:hypothetical protein C6P45_001013 [Maudiozyma exigua]|uniref:Uncharacterized protein n=1 Tax=Maudiozyma exigua TaxID=34358 RepID=A0A9P6WEL9_MAUEX|nr:hypothetical protein C6P45_001013 [Kazachstania exigua]